MANNPVTEDAEVTGPAGRDDAQPVAGEPVVDDAVADEQDAADDAAADKPAADAAVPDTADDPASAPTDADGDEPVQPAGGSRGRLPIVLGAASVLLAAFAILAGVKAHGGQADQNVALTNAAQTSQVRRQVSAAVHTIFSYNYADTAATRTAAQRLLTGSAVRQYDSLFGLVEKDAPAQHLVVTTTVTHIGVELLIGDRARLLVFADQRDTRSTTHQTSYAGTMFAVTAVRQGDRWKIGSIDTFTGTS
jgi:Mce-associated membrane protein